MVLKILVASPILWVQGENRFIIIESKRKHNSLSVHPLETKVGFFLRGGDQNQIIEWHTSAEPEIKRTDIK
jgi:hypothetical protein